MHNELKWWAYIAVGVVLFFFLVPAMISAKDTSLVIGGILFILAYLRWSWAFWVKPLLDKLEEEDL